MFRRIMVPLDGSELAEWAIPVAEQLAMLTGRLASRGTCIVHLVRVIDLTGGTWGPNFGVLSDEVARYEREQAHAYLQNMSARLEADGAQVIAQELTGDTVTTLLDYEQEAGIDLVVMCSHLRSGVSRLALGSVAERLLGAGTAPVLMVHAGTPTVDLQHAIVPLDGSPFAEQALQVVGGLAPHVVRRVTLLHVLGECEETRLTERYLAQCAQRLREYRIACDYRLLPGDPVQVILQLVQENKLLVMTTHCRNVLSRVARGSVADRVIHGGAAVVLLTRRLPEEESSV